jgi:hypothetical protein
MSGVKGGTGEEVGVVEKGRRLGRGGYLLEDLVDHLCGNFVLFDDGWAGHHFFALGGDEMLLKLMILDLILVPHARILVFFETVVDSGSLQERGHFLPERVPLISEPIYFVHEQNHNGFELWLASAVAAETPHQLLNVLLPVAD